MKENKPVFHSSDIPSVYEDYKEDLKRYISRRISFKEDVEDILQNIFYKLSEIDLEESPIERISSWLYSVAKNQITDFYRKKKNEPLPAISEDDDEKEFITDLLNLLTEDSDSPEMQYLQAMFWIELESALDEIPPEQRRIFELTELEGFSFKEVSESTGIPVNTLLSRKRYCILYLREKLEYLYDEIVRFP
jgi:RNA polymerase sigma factor (sigma-70 family)